MGLASILSEQASLIPLADLMGLQPAEIEQFATVAWQWLVLSALLTWTGALFAEYRLLTAFRGQQPSEIAAVLHLAAQRQRRQGWLWLSITAGGIAALFWLRISQALPHQQLNRLPDWAALWLFMHTTPEGWLWLARAGLALLAVGFAAALSLSAHRRARRERAPDLPTNHERRRHRWPRRAGAQTPHGSNALRSERWQHIDQSADHQPGGIANLEQRLLAERRHAQMSLALAAALLCAFLLPFPESVPAQFPLTALALHGFALLALALWLGGVLYLASVLAPATHIIESAERAHTFVEMLPPIKPTSAQAAIALVLYSLFSLETHAPQPPGFNALPALFSAPYGWLLLAALALLGGILLLTLYQARRALPSLAQAAWLAARGTVMSVMGGMDVSRSLQMSQRERQMLADQAERRLRRLAYLQFTLGLLIVLCLVAASTLGGAAAI